MKHFFNKSVKLVILEALSGHVGSNVFGTYSNLDRSGLARTWYKCVTLLHLIIHCILKNVKCNSGVIYRNTLICVYDHLCSKKVYAENQKPKHFGWKLFFLPIMIYFCMYVHCVGTSPKISFTFLPLSINRPQHSAPNIAFTFFQANCVCPSWCSGEFLSPQTKSGHCHHFQLT